jgi:hypothetical protein
MTRGEHRFLGRPHSEILDMRAHFPRWSLITLLPALVLACTTAPARGQATAVHVTTQHNDNARTGANLNETILTPANVNESQFGKLFSLAVDGDVYAQPLYLSGVVIGGKTHNVVYVATQHDSIFAFDGDAGGAPLWQVSFLGPNATTISTQTSAPLNNFDIRPEIGITGTPVIDLDGANPANSTLYVVAKTQETAGGVTSYVHRLHALDVATGAEKFGGPVVLQASFPGAGNGSDDPNQAGQQGNNDGQGNVLFAPPAFQGSLRANQRAGLLLQDGVVYAPFASHGDLPFYFGWLLGYDAKTLQQRAVFNSTPNGGRGGIWQSGNGPAAESGAIYLATGNGSFDSTKANFGDSVLRLAPPTAGGGNQLVVADFFTPRDQSTLAANDLDLGSGGVLLLPNKTGVHAPFAVVVGKSGVIYLLDKANLGKFDPNADHVAQRIPAVFNAPSPVGLVYGMPAYFNGSIYVVGTNNDPTSKNFNLGPLQQYQFAGGNLLAAPTSQSRHLFANRASTPSISANGDKDGIVWFIEAGGYQPALPATLHAYDARDLSRELYTSDLAITLVPNLKVVKRDQPGIGLKFCVPTIANGHVYVGTKNQVAVYGLLP